jgi:hypothetical protein
MIIKKWALIKICFDNNILWYNGGVSVWGYIEKKYDGLLLLHERNINTITRNNFCIRGSW